MIEYITNQVLFIFDLILSASSEEEIKEHHLEHWSSIHTFIFKSTLGFKT